MTDARTLAFVGVAVLVAGIFMGLAPAWQSSRIDLTHDLRAGGQQGTRHRSRARVVLLVLQGTLSVLLLIGAGLFVRSLHNVQRFRLGYDVAPVLTVSLHMREVTLDSARAVSLRDRLLATARGIAGVDDAALARDLPLFGSPVASIEVRGIDAATRSRFHEIYYSAVSPDYFATMGISVVRGRGIETGDVSGATGAVVVSRALAAFLWPGRDALGECVEVHPPGRRQRGVTPPCSYVVGIVEDIANVSLGSDPGFYYYLSAAQFNPHETKLVLRMRGDASRQADAVRRVLQDDMPGASYVTATPLAEIVGEHTRSWRLGRTTFAAFGLLALALATVGLYGVIAYDVEQRSREVGVRIALGARRSDVVWLIVRRGALLSALGIAIGSAVALAAAGRLAPLLFEVSSRDPLVYALVATTVLAVAVAASFIPARRAARMDPNVALRSD